MAAIHTSLLLTTVEAEKVLRLSPRTLDHHRVQGLESRSLKAGPGEHARMLCTLEYRHQWVGQTFSFVSEHKISAGGPN